MAAEIAVGRYPAPGPEMVRQGRRRVAVPEDERRAGDVAAVTDAALRSAVVARCIVDDPRERADAAQMVAACRQLQRSDRYRAAAGALAEAGPGHRTAPAECAICLVGQCVSPRRFPNPDCPHQYCASCLATLRGQAAATRCPQCRRPATPTRNGASPTPMARPQASAAELVARRRWNHRAHFGAEAGAASATGVPGPTQARPGTEAGTPRRAFVTRTGAKFHRDRACHGLRHAAAVWEGSALGKEPCALCCGATTERSPGFAPPASAVPAPAAPRPSPAARHFTTRTGRKYHSRRDCRGLRSASAVFEQPGGAPLGGSLEPCRVCCG